MAARSVFKASLIASSLLGAALLGAGAAGAQGNPSADQIINSLRPGGSLGGGTRGIRPMAPASEAPPAAPMAAPGTASGGRPAAASTARPQIQPRTPGATQAATPGATQAAPPGAAPGIAAAPSVNLSVQFATNSAELTPGAVRTLSELGRALASATLGSYRFRIEGHTDTRGSAEANKLLSERRAAAVVAFLASRFGIDRSRLESAGMGEDGLLVQTPPNTAEPRNRRVQVINLGA